MSSSPRPAMAFGEFVSFIAACMALNAISIDIMLPALPMMAADLELTDPNQAQAVIAFFLIGTGISQLFYGPFADRFGRKPVIIVGLLLFIAGGIMTLTATTFSALLAARVLQGIGSGSPRVMAVSLARDCYAGAQMARVMSMAVMVFMIVPVLAPSVGQVVLFIAPSAPNSPSGVNWHWVFGVLVLSGVAMLIWTVTRLSETLPSTRRMPLTPRSVYSAYRQVLTTRRCAGYTLALSFVVGAHMGFISSAQQIFVDVFGAKRSFPLLFAAIALTTGIAAFVNSKLVRRIGMRRLAVAGLVSIVTINLFHLWIDESGHETLMVFMLMQAASVFMFGLLAANLNALAMEPMGHIAGTASSMVGFISTIISALIGLFIGSLFDGTVIPLNGAYVVLAAVSLVIAWYSEKPASPQPPPHP